MILGIMPSSCKKYGTEATYFVLNGNIKGNTNQPISQIRVTKRDITVRSDSSGNYLLRYDDYSRNTSFNIKYIDADSTEHGSFKDKYTTIKFEGGPFKDGEEVTKTINIRLDPK